MTFYRLHLYTICVYVVIGAVANEIPSIGFETLNKVSSLQIKLTSSYYIVIPILYLFLSIGYAVEDAVDWFIPPTA